MIPIAWLIILKNLEQSRSSTSRILATALAGKCNDLSRSYMRHDLNKLDLHLLLKIRGIQSKTVRISFLPTGFCFCISRSCLIRSSLTLMDCMRIFQKFCLLPLMRACRGLILPAMFSVVLKLKQSKLRHDLFYLNFWKNTALFSSQVFVNSIENSGIFICLPLLNPLLLLTQSKRAFLNSSFLWGRSGSGGRETIRSDFPSASFFSLIIQKSGLMNRICLKCSYYSLISDSSRSPFRISEKSCPFFYLFNLRQSKISSSFDCIFIRNLCWTVKLAPRWGSSRWQYFSLRGTSPDTIDCYSMASIYCWSWGAASGSLECWHSEGMVLAQLLLDILRMDPYLSRSISWDRNRLMALISSSKSAYTFCSLLSTSAIQGLTLFIQDQFMSKKWLQIQIRIQFEKANARKLIPHPQKLPQYPKRTSQHYPEAAESLF